MKMMKTISCAAMALSMLCAAMPAAPVFAAEGEEEAAVMTAVVQLNGDSAVAEGSNVTVEGGKITITASGSYEFKGKLDNGQICVNVPDKTVDAETVKLFFNGVTITGLNDAAVYIVNAENTSINLVAETENYLYDGETYSETDAVIYAKDDMTIKGDGSLRIEAAYQYGIQCNDDLKFNGGKVKVKTEVQDGVRGKKSVTVKDGKLDVNAEGDGIKSTKGDVTVSGGKVEVKAGNDAIQGETAIAISGGKVLANGDRGLRCDEGTITISGGEVLATATDNQVPNLTAEQAALLLAFNGENVKDMPLAVFADGAAEPVFEMTSDKKFSFALISSANLKKESTYSLTLGGTAIEGAQNIKLAENLTVIENLASVAADPLPFDIDDDGEVNVNDAIILARYVSEDISVKLSEKSTARTDCNQDGIVDMNDVVLLINTIAGLA